MSIILHTTASSQKIYSFGAALQQLARRNGELTDTLESFLIANTSKLARCNDPFKAPSAGSRSKIDSGAGVTTSEGENFKLATREKDVVKQLADTLIIDEVEAACLLRAYRQSKGEDVKDDIEASTVRSDDFWMEITSFVLDEQLRIIQLVAFLLRTADLEEHVPAEVVHRLAADVTTPQFASTILERVTHLMTTSIPPTAVPYSPIWAKSWVQQQKALLEVYFLLYYNRLFPNGKSLLQVLNYVKMTEWGTMQVSEGLFDTEAQALSQDVAALSQLILVENFNLERAASPQAEELSIIPGKTMSEEELLHPVTLRSVHHLVIELVTLHPRQSALLALSWSLVLSRITESMSSVPLPEAYYDVAQEVLPADLHPRKGDRVGSANEHEQALWQQLVTHALSPHASCLSLLVEIINSTLLHSGTTLPSNYATSTLADPNLAGYLSVLRSALAAVPRLVQPSYLPQEDFSDVIAVFEALYSHPAASLLRGSFWGLFEEHDENPIREEEWRLFELAIKRFPAEVGPFVRMACALSGGRSDKLLSSQWDDKEPGDDEASIAKGCVGKILECLKQPRCITQTLPPISPVMPLPYEPSKRIQAGPADIIAVRPVNISPSIVVPAGTAGRIVSKLDHRPLIVSWDTSLLENPALAALRFFGDSIARFAVLSKTKSERSSHTSHGQGDVFKPSHTDSGVPEAFYRPVGDLLPDITNMLELIRNLIITSPEHAIDVMTMTFGSRKHGLQTLFSILEISASSENMYNLFVVVNNLVAALLGTYPDDIWTYLRSSDTIFPMEDTSATLPIWGSRRNANRAKDLLSQDRTRGQYRRTIACLELVQSLVLQAQWTTDTDAIDASREKGTVLARAVRWCLDSIWTGYSSWRYNNLSEKFEIGLRLSQILNEVLEEAALGSKHSLGQAGSAVLSTFTGAAAYAYGSVLLDTIIGGTSSLYTLSNLGKSGDCAILEACLDYHLQVVFNVLVLSRRSSPNEPSTLEKLLLAHTPVTSQHESRGDAIFVLTELSVSAHIPRIATAAAKLLALISRLSVLWGAPSERPSMLSHCGGVRQSNELVNRLLDIAGDPYADVQLQLSIWGFLTSAMDCQAGLAAVLITGHQALAGGSDDLTQSGGSGMTLAIEVLRGWREAWDVQPALLYAALAFLDAVWQGYVDSNKTVQDLRKTDDLWQTATQIIQKDLEPPAFDISHASNQHSIDYAYRRSSQALAAHWLSLDVQYTLVTSSAGDLPVAASPSIRYSTDLISAPENLETCLKNLKRTSFDADLIEGSSSGISEVFDGLKLESFAAPQDFVAKPYGKAFFYSRLIGKRLIGAARICQVSPESVINAHHRIDDLNMLWSKSNAEDALMQGWGHWIETILYNTHGTAAMARSIGTAIQWLDRNLDIPTARSPVTERHYAGILGIVLSLTKFLARQDYKANDDVRISLMNIVGKIYSSDSFSIPPPPQEELPKYPITVSQICYFAHQVRSHTVGQSVDLRRSIKARASESSQTCLLACLTGLGHLTEVAGNPDVAIQEHIRWSSAAICEVLSSQNSSSSAQWLVHCHNLDFFGQCGSLLGRLQFSDKDVDTAIAILDILLAMARLPQAAESMALDGIVLALCNNAMTETLESASLTQPSPQGPQRYPAQNFLKQHEVWISFVSLVCQLVLHLGSRLPFVNSELATFLQMYRRQIMKTLSWSSDNVLSFMELKEHQAIYALLSSCVTCTTEESSIQPMLHKMLLASLQLLQHHVYLVQHPNLLMTLLCPLSAQESDWLSEDADTLETIGLADLNSHPVAACVTQHILSLCCLHVTTLVKYSQSFTTLVKERVDWPKNKVLIAATTNVSLEESATLGTLFDLARFCNDVSRYCKPRTEALTSPLSPLPTYDHSTFIETAEQCLEATLLLMSTQIALTAQQQDVVGRQDRASQRARRDLKEVASDLVEEFLDKNTGTSPPQERKLTDILKKFVLQL